MKTINKKKRYWFLGGALVLTVVLVWWAQAYCPLRDQRDEKAVELSKLIQERDRLKQRRDKLSGAGENHRRTNEVLAQVREWVVPGKDPEEVSAYTQLWIQEFIQGHDLSLSTYRGLYPSKWEDYTLCRVQFQINATIQGLSDLLESLENMGKAITIQKLRVDYRRSREMDLHVSLELGALFMEGLTE